MSKPQIFTVFLLCIPDSQRHSPAPTGATLKPYESLEQLDDQLVSQVNKNSEALKPLFATGDKPLIRENLLRIVEHGQHVVQITSRDELDHARTVYAEVPLIIGMLTGVQALMGQADAAAAGDSEEAAA